MDASESPVRGRTSPAAGTDRVAPRGTPAPIVQLLNREINAQLETQALRDQFATVGVAAEGGTPAQFMAFIESEIEKWAAVAAYAGMTKQKY